MKFPNINPGDLVILPWRDRRSPGRVATVERVTKTQFTAGEARWSRDRGVQIGTADAWRSYAAGTHRKYAQPATPELIEACRAHGRLETARLRCDRLTNRLITSLRERFREACSTSGKLQLAELLERVAALLEQAVEVLAVEGEEQS